MDEQLNVSDAIGRHKHEWDTYDGYTKLCREINMVPMPYKLWEQVHDWHVAHGNYEER